MDAPPVGLSWAPSECRLPTAEQPLRVAEFDDLLSGSLIGQQRRSPTRLRWRLRPAAEAVTRELTARESACCSFFRFTITAGTELLVDVEVPAAQVGVLDALAARADDPGRRPG